MWKNKVISALATSTCSSVSEGGSIYSMPLRGENFEYHNNNNNRALSHTGLLQANNNKRKYRSNFYSTDYNQLNEIPSHNPHFIPIKCHVYCLIGVLVTALSTSQFILCASLHTNNDTVPIRVLFIPLVYYFLIIVLSAYFILTDGRLFLDTGYFRFYHELEDYIKIPCMIHSIMFTIIGVLISCTKTEHDNSELLYISENVRENIAVILWSIIHVVELIYWANFVRVCLVHNQQKKSPDAIEEEERLDQQAKIRQQQILIKKYENQVKLNSEYITNLNNNPRPITKTEETLVRKKGGKEQEIKTLNTEKIFLQTRAENIKSEYYTKDKDCLKLKKAIIDFELERNLNEQYLHELRDQIQRLTVENNKKKILVSVVQKQAEQSRQFFDLFENQI